MDDPNYSQDPLAATAPSGVDRQLAPTGQLQTIAAVCATMKDEIAAEAQQMVSGTTHIGKQPTFTEACSVMKGQMATEVHHIIGVPHGSDTHPLAASSPDFEYPQRKELEQAKLALKEANWFEQ